MSIGMHFVKKSFSKNVHLRGEAMEEYKDMEKMLRDVDFTKRSDHKERLKKKLFSESKVSRFSDELDLDAMKNVRAAAKEFDGIKKE